MSRKIKIVTEDFELEANLLEEEKPETCDAIWDALPFEGSVSHYKEEIYFDIPVDITPEKATGDTERGDVSYWPEGPAFCIFYGDSKPVSPVSTFAKVEEGVEKFGEVDSGEEIWVEKA